MLFWASRCTSDSLRWYSPHLALPPHPSPAQTDSQSASGACGSAICARHWGMTGEWGKEEKEEKRKRGKKKRRGEIKKRLKKGENNSKLFLHWPNHLLHFVFWSRKMNLAFLILWGSQRWNWWIFMTFCNIVLVCNRGENKSRKRERRD